MASDANKSYMWGILGCGWLGRAMARSVHQAGDRCWGTGRSESSLAKIREAGAVAVPWEGEGAVDWPACDHLLVALPPSAGHPAFEEAARLGQACRHVVLISSTSVYPAAEGTYREADAVRRVSPHSGACLLDIENSFTSHPRSILRAGGLFGPGRHPRQFLRGGGLKDPDGAVNMVHVDDVVRAIHHVANKGLMEAFNVVAPEPTTRARFYAEAGAIPATEESPISPKGRRVLSHALIDSGFTFLHPNPALAVRQLDESV